MTRSSSSHRPRVTVVGTVFEDRLRVADKVVQAQGGVGRNVALNLARAGLDVTFVTLLDAYGSALSALVRSGLRVHGRESAMGLGSFEAEILDDGEVRVLSVRRPEAAELTWEHVRHCLEEERPEAVVVESGLSRSLLEALYRWCRNRNSESFAMVTNVDGPGGDPALLGGFDWVFMNRQEAERVLGRALRTPDEVTAAVGEWTVRAGTSLIVTMGALGVVAATGAEPPVWYTAAAASRVVSTLGAGDAFAAGFIAARLREASTGGAITAGLEAGRDVLSALTAVGEPAG